MMNTSEAQDDYTRKTSTLRDPTAFDAARETFESVSKLSDRILLLVDRIVGHERQGVAGDPVKSAPTPVLSVVDELRDRASRGGRAIQNAHEALDRLESQI